MNDERTFSDGSEEVIGCCIEVHRHLGPGLLESVYEESLCHELGLRGLKFERQRRLPVSYKGVALLRGALVLDVLVEGRILIEIKSVELLLPVHEAQVITYLKLAGLDVGLLINFNVPLLRQGLKRLIRYKQ